AIAFLGLPRHRVGRQRPVARRVRRDLSRLDRSSWGQPSGGPCHGGDSGDEGVAAAAARRAEDRCDGRYPLAARIAPPSRRSYLAGPLRLLAVLRGLARHVSNAAAATPTSPVPLRRGAGGPARRYS